jgi:pimeloyl-ACP methyl ester carboxylesterase
MLRPPRPLGWLASAVDRAATAAVRLSRPAAGPLEDVESRIALCEALANTYGAQHARIFPEPVPVEPWVVRDGGVLDLSWPSRHEVLERSVAEELSLHRANGTCHVRLRSRPGPDGAPRPVAVFLHGYLAGHYAFEERIWPLERFDALGYDTALFTLPFHGFRATVGGRNAPPFPGRDPAINVESFRQAVGDLRDFLCWLRTRGHPTVGLVGMSLGGYMAALTATVEQRLAFLVPVIPLACLVDFALEQGHLEGTSSRARRLEEALRKVYATVSPCCRPPCLQGKRVLVIGARADQITSVHHARRLAHHFSAPLHTWPGGHLLQWGRAAAFERVEQLLRDVRLDPATPTRDSVL